MPFLEYGVTPPRENWELLNSGQGPVPLINTSSAYRGVRTALEAAASSTDGSLSELASAWPGGLSSQRAQAAFRKHNEWVRAQTMVADALASAADAGTELHSVVVGLMPSIFEIALVEANLITALGDFVATSGTPATLVTAPKLTTAVGAYMVVWGRATHAMVTYEVGATALVTKLAAVAAGIQPPPPILAPTGGGGSAPSVDASGPLHDLANNGPNSQLLSDHPTQSGGDGGQSGGDGGGSDSGGTDSGGGTDPAGTDPAGGDSGGGDPTQPLSEHPGTEPYAGQDGSSSLADQLLGTPSSSTLAGLNGGVGVGGLAALGMMRGGIGAMPGAATGFRMPTGWGPGTGTPFGASTGAPTGAPVRNGPGRVSAPTARMRRRRKEEEEKSGKVFTPGEQFEVPVLERAPAIGVIEYQDQESEEELLHDSSLVGVLDRLDETAEPENGENTR